MVANNEDFDNVIDTVGSNGPFQRRFNWIFVCFFTILLVPTYNNLYMILAVPNHTCRAPERTNFTVNEWKTLHIPKVFDKNGNYELSKCKMLRLDEKNRTIKYEVDCTNGWDFDKTWYKSTVATQEEWVCDKMWNVPYAFTIGRIGDIFGNLLYGQLSDILGRKSSLFILLIIYAVGKFVIIFSSHWSYLFYVLVFIGSSPSITLYQLPMVVATEMSEPETRTQVVLFHGIGWAVGFGIMPLIMWAVGDWVYYMVISTLPLMAFLLLYRIFPESPRWLASVGDFDKCLEILKEVARVNKKVFPEDMGAIIRKISPKHDQTYGLLSLFSNWRLGINTVVLAIQMATGSYLFNILALNINSISVNPFINLSFQGIIEYPGYKLGKLLCDKFGRKWVNVASYFCSFLCCVPIYVMIYDSSYDVWVFWICILLKFFVTVSDFVLQLMTLEIYPTCSRQTGFATQSVVGCAFSILVPYTLQLASNENNKALPYISMGVLTVIACVSGVLLPETIDKKLPETLEETADFGADQNFWGQSKNPA